MSLLKDVLGALIYLGKSFHLRKPLSNNFFTVSVKMFYVSSQNVLFMLVYNIICYIPAVLAALGQLVVFYMLWDF